MQRVVSWLLEAREPGAEVEGAEPETTCDVSEDAPERRPDEQVQVQVQGARLPRAHRCSVSCLVEHHCPPWPLLPLLL